MITEEKNVELTSVTTQRYYIINTDANGETKTEAEAGNTLQHHTQASIG